MRAAVVGVVLGFCVILVGAVGFPEAAAQKSASPLVSHHPSAHQQTGSADLLALSAEAEGRQQITVIDPKQKVLAVYHVDRTTGAVSLRSVRNLQWDLLIEDFNSANPTPREIRALTQQR